MDNFSVNNISKDNVSTTEHFSDSIIVISIGGLSLAGNSAVVIILWLNERFRNAVNGILACMSASDLVATVIVFPFTFLYVYCSRMDALWYMMSFFSNFSRTLSSLCVTFLVLDRYLSLKDLSRSTSSKSVMWIAFGSCCVSFSTTLTCYLDSPNSKYTFTLDQWNGVYEIVQFSYSTNTWIMMFYAIFRISLFSLILWSSMKMICLLCGKGSKKNDYKLRIAAEVEGAVTVLILAAAHILCQFPLCVNQFLIYNLHKEDSHFHVDSVIILFSWSNMAINPIVYAIRNKNFRRMLRSRKCDTYDVKEVTRRREMINHFNGIDDSIHIITNGLVRYISRSSQIEFEDSCMMIEDDKEVTEVMTL